MVHLMHEMSKRREKESQCEDAAKVLRQSKGTTHFHAKAQGSASIAAHWATLQVFSTKQRIKNAKMQRMQRTMTAMYL